MAIPGICQFPLFQLFEFRTIAPTPGLEGGKSLGGGGLNQRPTRIIRSPTRKLNKKGPGFKPGPLDFRRLAVYSFNPIIASTPVKPRDKR